MLTTFTPAMADRVFAGIREAERDFNRRCPGESGQRQPVHTVYGGAHLFKSGTIEKIGALARRYFTAYSPNAGQFAKALDMTGPASAGETVESLAQRVYERVAEKLNREPVEDFRIDFEDGYGHRPPGEEDAHAEGCARAVAQEMAAGALPPFFGIRIRSLRDECNGRRGRTLDIFLTALAHATGGRLPQNFVVTLPKVTLVQEVAGLVDQFEILEGATGIAPGSLKLEIMVESPHTLVDPSSGCLNLPLLAAAAGGRCVAAHFGAYDFTAAMDVVSAYQHMGHPACDFARLMMQTGLAGTGIRLSDGATIRLPLEPHRAAGGSALTQDQMAENRRAVHRAWRESYANIRRSLEGGLYQGWDLHPAQLPVRYAATYAFFLEQQAAVGRRLRTFIEKAARASEQGGVFDDAATGQGMLNFFLRGINCGAFAEQDAVVAGLSAEEVQTRSFAAILKNRCS